MNDIRLVGQVEAAGICESMVSLWWVYLWVQLDPRSGELNYTVMGGLTFRLLQGHQIWYWLKGDCWALAEVLYKFKSLLSLFNYHVKVRM